MKAPLHRIRDILVAHRRASGAFCAVVAVALLFWARLIVISDMPRTAIADTLGPDAATTSRPGPTTSDKGEVGAHQGDSDAHSARDPFATDDSARR